MTSASCSTTTIVLPRSRSSARIRIKRPQSRTFAVGALGVSTIAAEEHANVHFVFLRLDFLKEAAHMIVHELLFFGGQVGEGSLQANLALLYGLFEGLVPIPAVLRLSPWI